jgi:para-nitrobenzyl esterase
MRTDNMLDSSGGIMLSFTNDEKTSLDNAQSARTSLVSPTRRDLMKGLAMAAVAGGLGSAATGEAAGTDGYPTPLPSTGASVRASDSDPVVETAYGRVRGYVRNGIYAFKNIPYGADTSGTNRFMPPQKPAPWSTVRPCLHHGYVSPQAARTGWKNNEESWLFQWDDGIQNEDCLNLNVWTSSTGSGKRPVMVWLHGGGFAAGSATELPSYDGENLARRGVVLVSVTHRLNAMGFLNLGSYGDKYADSGNVGMLDIVAALEWVRDNIANFGGDPSRVTIFGQSGGGGKVTALMAMPGAKGLFHRAIVESGSLLTTATVESSNATADKFLKQLKLSGADVDKLQQMPFEALQKAASEVAAMRIPASGVIDFRRISRSLGWSPVAGSPSMPTQPFDPGAPEMSASVPMIVGNTINEFVNGINKPDAFKMTQEELATNIRNIYKEKADDVLSTYRKSLPNANNFQLWSAIATGGVRAMALEQVRRKTAQHAAPAYLYRFDWQTPILDGRPMAFHCSELAFVFDNAARCENMTGNSAAAHALAEKMNEAWVHFATNGDPNHSGIPRWKPFDPATNGSMVFDNECAFHEHLDDDCQKVIALS